jgi:NAD+ kinase
VPADELERALDRFRSDDWIARRLPALAIRPAGGDEDWAVNDFVIVRRGAGQVLLNLSVDDELYVRMAGDGLVAATPLGSSAYSMAAGGPVLAPNTRGIVCTPVAMHGGNAPPLVVPSDSVARVELRSGHVGFEVQVDGHSTSLQELDYEIALHEEKVTLVAFEDGLPMLSSMRERGLITDSPRVIAREG